MTSLVPHLRAMSDEALAHLLQRRPDLAAPAPSDLSSLARRASMPYSVVRAVTGLNLFESQVMEVAVVLQPPTLDRLREATDSAAPWEATLRALASLEDLALVWRTGDGSLETVACLPQVTASPLGLGSTAEEVCAMLPRMLGETIVATLREDLLGAGIAPPPARAATLAFGSHPGAAIAKVLADPLAVRTLLGAAPPGALEVLTTLAAGTPFGQVPQASERRLDADSPNPVTWLMSRGLIVPVDENTVAMPREVGVVVRGDHLVHRLDPQPPQPEGRTFEPASVDSAGAGAAGDALRHVVDLLDYWTERPPATLRAGGVGIREIRRTAKALEAEESQIVLTASIAYQAGMLDITVQDEELTLLPTHGYDTWLDGLDGLNGDDAERWASLVQAWLTMPRWPELVTRDDATSRAALLSGDDTRSDAAGVRRRVLEVLAELPDGAAPGPETVAQALHWYRPHAADLSDATAVVLAEAATLGLTGRGALTGAARRLLRGEVANATEAMRGSLPAPVDHVLAQADHTLVAPGPLRPDLARMLSRIAERESTGGATVYRITEASLRRGLDSGMSAGEMIELLHTRSRTPVPQSLEYLVRDTARTYGRLRIAPAAAYIRCDDEAHLSEVLADRRLRGLGLRRVAPTVLVADLSVARALEALRGQGYAPVAENADGSPVLTGKEQRRAPSTRRGSRLAGPVLDGFLAGRGAPGGSTGPGADAAVFTGIVRALRRADRARAAAESARLSRAGREGGDGGYRPVPAARIGPALREAAAKGHAVWMSYVNREGVSSERIIEPITVSGNLIEAYDHLRSEVRTFLLERILSIVPLDAGAAEILGGEP